MTMRARRPRVPWASFALWRVSRCVRFLVGGRDFFVGLASHFYLFGTRASPFRHWQRSYPSPYCTQGNYLVGTTCTICPAGSSCVGESWTSVAVPCAPGTYQSATGQTGCATCTKGNFCASSSVGGPIPAMTTCPAGSYCPSTGMSAPIAASPGYYVAATGAEVQVQATAGSYVVSSTAQTAQVAASPGYYVPLAGATQQIDCPKGATCPGPGRTSFELCGLGTYCPSTGMQSATGTQCPAGMRECMPW